MNVFKILLVTMLALTLAYCKKDKDDNNLFLLSALWLANQANQIPNSETVSLQANTPVAQQLKATKGTEVNYSIKNPSDTSSKTVSKNTTPETAVITVSLTDLETGEKVITSSSMPGRSITVKYTPTKDGILIVQFSATAALSITTNVTGAVLESRVVPPMEIPAVKDSPTKNIAVLGNTFYISGSAIPNSGLSSSSSYNIVTVGFYDVTVSNNVATYTAITSFDTATASVNGGAAINGTYANPSWDFTTLKQDGIRFILGTSQLIPGDKIKLVIKKPSKGINIEKELYVPSYITGFKINDLADNVTISKSAETKFSWDLPSSNLPNALLLNIGQSSYSIPTDNKTIVLNLPLASGSVTLPAGAFNSISEFTASASNATDNCINTIFAGYQLNFPLYYNGVNTSGTTSAFESGIVATNFGSAPYVFCESNVPSSGNTFFNKGQRPTNAKNLTITN